MEAIFSWTIPGQKTEDLSLGWFAISHRWFEDKKKRRESYGKLFKVKSKNFTIYRTLKFSPRLKGIDGKTGQILIDWNGWFNLAGLENEKNEISLEIKKANVFEIFFHSVRHPDPAYRHSMAVARTGLYISLISLILAFK